MGTKKINLMPSYSVKGSEMELLALAREQEHEWRKLLQKQLGDHWLNLNYLEEMKP